MNPQTWNGGQIHYLIKSEAPLCGQVAGRKNLEVTQPSVHVFCPCSNRG